MSADEGKYLKPYLKASRLWLGKSLVAFPSLEGLTSALLKAVVIPTSEWLESQQLLAEEFAGTRQEVSYGRCRTDVS